MSKQLTCETCGQKQPADQFRKLNELMARNSGRSHSKDCATCRAARRAEKRAEREAAAVEEVEDTPVPEGWRMSVARSLGISVTYDGADFVVTQDAGDGKTTTMWLAPHEVRQLFEFAQGLARQLPEPTP